MRDFWADLHYYFERIGIMPVMCNIAMKITDTCTIPIPTSAQLNRLIRYTFPAFKKYYDVRRTIMVKKMWQLRSNVSMKLFNHIGRAKECLIYKWLEKDKYNTHQRPYFR